MELKAKVIEIKNIETTPNLFFKRVIIVEEINEKFPKKIAIDFIKDNIKLLDNIKVGDRVSIDYFLESREYKGVWYTSVRGLSISLI